MTVTYIRSAFFCANTAKTFEVFSFIFPHESRGRNIEHGFMVYWSAKKPWCRRLRGRMRSCSCISRRHPSSSPSFPRSFPSSEMKHLSRVMFRLLQFENCIDGTRWCGGVVNLHPPLGPKCKLTANGASWGEIGI